MEVLLQNADNSYSFTYMNPDIFMDSNGNLQGEYNGTSLYVLDDDNTPLSFELEYWTAVNQPLPEM